MRKTSKRHLWYARVKVTSYTRITGICGMPDKQELWSLSSLWSRVENDGSVMDGGAWGYRGWGI